MMIWGWIAVIVGIVLIINLASMGKYLDEAYIDGYDRGYSRGYTDCYKKNFENVDSILDEDDGK